MTEKTNEEKLKILQERLSVINKKQTEAESIRKEENKKTSPVFEEDLANKKDIKEEQHRPPLNTKPLIIILILAGVAFGIYWSTTLDITSLILSKESSLEEKIEDKKNQIENEDIIYNANAFNTTSGYIIVLSGFFEKEQANAYTISLQQDGYNAFTFCLKDVSNSDEEIFHSYLGPFNTKEEAKQWKKSSKSILEFGEIIKL